MSYLLLSWAEAWVGNIKSYDKPRVLPPYLIAIRSNRVSGRFS